MLDLDLDTLVSVCGGLLPGHFEIDEVVFKAREWVVVLQVVLAELLDDDQNEKVEHDVGHNHVEENVEQRCDTRAARCALNTTLVGAPRVVHDAVPVFARRDGEEQREALVEVLEVLEVADHVTLRHLEEQGVAQYSHDEENQHEEHKDVE